MAYKKIGVLTSGGDCAGLNAVIRAVVHAAHQKGWDVVGIEDGTHGALERPVRYQDLSPAMFDTGVMRMGGTILGTTNRGDPFKFPMPDGTFKDRSEEIIEGLKQIGIEALIGIGGDGSMAILKRLAEQGGIPLIGVPKTMDNDLGVTENAVGFESAVHVACEALDRLQPTAASHDRIMVLEVMGRDAGHVALSAGIAGGADVILIPEIEYNFESMVKKINAIRVDEKRNFGLVIVSEAIKTLDGEKAQMEYAGGQKRYGGIGHYIGENLENLTGSETRVSVLGHVQRGCSPIAGDRILASALGVHAVQLIEQGKSDRMVAWSNRSVIDVSIAEAIDGYEAVDVSGTLVKTARALGISFGD